MSLVAIYSECQQVYLLPLTATYLFTIWSQELVSFTVSTFSFGWSLRFWNLELWLRKFFKVQNCSRLVVESSSFCKVLPIIVNKMPAKLFVLAFLVILFQLNQLTLGEELTYLKPICNGTERAWTDQKIFDQCSNNLWSHTIYNARDMVKYKTCIDSKMGEVITVPACCEGYKMVKNDNNRCELDCQRCKHGECDGGECSCAIGFGGKWCDTPCPAANFGLQCEHNCEWWVTA